MIILGNGNLTASIHPKGAELQSLVNSQNKLQYMWSGDSRFWGKHSPVLFPIVGTLRNGQYCYKGENYHLPRHGFALEKEFSVQQPSTSEAWFTLCQDEQTLLVYPFKFELSIGYQLEDDAINCTYRVVNKGDEDLLFSVGGHPAFAVPLVADTSYNDYYLKFNHHEPLVRHKLSDGLISDTTETVAVEDGKLLLDQHLFDEDAMVFKNLQSSTVILASDKHTHGLEFDFSGFPFLGLWAARNAPFLCIEPWCGIADSIHHQQELHLKEGIQTIAPGIQWQRTWSARCF